MRGEGSKGKSDVGISIEEETSGPRCDAALGDQQHNLGNYTPGNTCLRTLIKHPMHVDTSLWMRQTC